MRGILISTAVLGLQTEVSRLTAPLVNVLPSSEFLISLIYSGVVPQQPPTTFTPYLSSPQTHSANLSGKISYSLLFGSGSPALALTISGKFVYSLISDTTPSSSSGPREQFTPRAETPSPVSVSAAEAGDTPVKVLPLRSKVIVAITGLSEFSFAASTAAFNS